MNIETLANCSVLQTAYYTDENQERKVIVLAYSTYIHWRVLVFGYQREDDLYVYEQNITDRAFQEIPATLPPRILVDDNTYLCAENRCEVTASLGIKEGKLYVSLKASPVEQTVKLAIHGDAQCLLRISEELVPAHTSSHYPIAGDEAREVACILKRIVEEDSNRRGKSLGEVEHSLQPVVYPVKNTRIAQFPRADASLEEFVITITTPMNDVLNNDVSDPLMIIAGQLGLGGVTANYSNMLVDGLTITDLTDREFVALKLSAQDRLVDLALIYHKVLETRDVLSIAIRNLSAPSGVSSYF